MSEGQTEIAITTEVDHEQAVTLDNGMLVVDLASLPAGSVVTLTVRVGPEAPVPQPEAAPTRRHMGGPRINGGAA